MHASRPDDHDDRADRPRVAIGSPLRSGHDGALTLALAASEPDPTLPDPALTILTCANCGAAMLERKCKLICRCGYFLSCSDYQ